MSEIHTIRITVLRENLYGAPDTMSGWIKWLEDKFANVPVEHRSTAVLEINSEGGYEGEHHAEASIYYYRAETADEAATRKNRALSQAAEAWRLSKRWHENAERLQKEAE